MADEKSTILERFPLGKWLTIEEVKGMVGHAVAEDGLKRYLNILVTENRIERRYVRAFGAKRRTTLYRKSKSELKQALPRRRCLMCQQFFTPRHRFNFICCHFDNGGMEETASR